MADPKVRADRTLAPALVKAFEDRPTTTIRGCAGIWPWPSAASIRRCRREAVAVLTEGRSTIRTAKSRISAIWALGVVGRPGGRADACSRSIASPDAGIRKMVVYALGALPGEAQLDDAAHGAAGLRARRALECGGRARAPRQSRRRAGAAADARPRSTSSRSSSATSAQDEDRGSDCRRDDQRPARGGGAEGRDARNRRSTTLSQQDRSMKVRQAALEALKVMG